ncbi:MAG TPA: toll/interleukin-1 receptor domain-containing protein [Gaiellaceae bacterium]|nr:toll/interleukin-1 receptor domain-containing protein [Gaiellaceae bacterium]
MMAVSSRIFVSYRREDATAYAGRLYDILSAEFPAQVFMDIDTLEPGVDFAQRIEESVGSADVLVAVIGRGWVTAVDRDGRRRLDDPDDWVRLEIAEALRRDIRVIPVLVGGASMPESGELSEDLAGLRRRNGLVISDFEWRAGADRLVTTLYHVLGIEPPRRRGPVVPAPSAAVLPLAIAGAALLTAGVFMRWNNGKSFFQNDFNGALSYGGVFTSLAPIAIAVAALVGLLLVREPRQRPLGVGVLLGAGIAGAAKYLAVLEARHDAGLGAMIGVLGAFAGGVLVLAAGIIASRGTPTVASARCVTGASSAVGGAVLLAVALGTPFNGTDASGVQTKVAASGDGGFDLFALDPILTTLAVAVIGALLAWPWRHTELSAALLTLGCIEALFWVRYLCVPLLADSSDFSFGPAGIVGLAGAGLVLAGGYLGLQAARATGVQPVAIPS